MNKKRSEGKCEALTIAKKKEDLGRDEVRTQQGERAAEGGTDNWGEVVTR